MNEAQLTIAKSYDGLIDDYVTDMDALEQAREDLGNMNCQYRSSKLHRTLVDLQDTVNNSINTDVHVGTVCIPAADAVITVAGMSIALPIPAEKVTSLYTALNPSLVGVEMRGDVFDTNLRMSHEAPADSMQVSHSISTFDFPFELEEIHQKICPSAVSIRAELYKLVMYGVGDFFVPHRDSMSSADMFGSISMQLPILSESGTSQERTVSNSVKDPGQLVFYIGRETPECNCESLSTSSMYSDCYNADVQWAHTVDLGSLERITTTDGNIAMSFAAWTGDVLHEVRRVESGYRAVLVYRLYKQGHKESYIPLPLRLSVEEKIMSVFNTMNSEAHHHFRYLGVILRHAYAPAGLQPEYLKGIDAVMYSIASKTNKCLLFNAHQVDEGPLATRYNLRKDAVTYLMFLTTEVVPADVDFSSDDARESMAKHYKVFTNTAWIQLGFGTLVGGGFCFGNVTTSTDWWYRSAVMIITQEPSLWMRRRPLFLIMTKGSRTMRQLNSLLEVMKTIASFL
ncbi:uncharacterized protein TM35_000015990 [Trypanosoma theileri]|uniref:Prolyl 4-hydroxylase alpha subunit Fe(2+) 2OG dioxygenase domain-containing protein n=1 Tax=Trypanosoma theileri TaxID=67003 RepID=A0A1X0P9W1_9TRYP|nr:uncharacterized protein TM35_000015990 [Trypanosoma theileri]ORC93722.1 hypothetical protein TM35_000015990 [Trypanosoma theileri]